MHGGRNPGAPPGNGNAITHGVYVSRLSAEEEALLPQIRAKIGSIDGELMVAYIELRRILLDERRMLDATTLEEEVRGFEVAFARKTTKSTSHGLVDVEEVVLRRPDFGAKKDRMLMRIGKMELLRQQILEWELTQKLLQLQQLLGDSQPSHRPDAD